MFPTPKYRRIEKIVRHIDVINPRRELAKSSENIKRKLVNNKTKKTGNAPKVSGSTK